MTQVNIDDPALPPLSLYVHIPWCVKKCPYCDFNSHAQSAKLPIDEYLAALVEDLRADAPLAQGRKIQSIFFGGGTPSLFPAKAIAAVIEAADRNIGLSKQVEITLEANPGTTEYDNFADLIAAGVNRLSMGVQSFNDEQLGKLGRIHSSEQAVTAIRAAQDSGFSNLNIDIMHGLPQQSLKQALADLERALEFQSSHLSWYQLTIEPNTTFYTQPPTLPSSESLWDIHHSGIEFLTSAGFQRYEISAFSRQGQNCKHNMNYWEFGDYLGIGAGAHGKITAASGILRTSKTRLPKNYLSKYRQGAYGKQENITAQNLPLEFMMNALRLLEGVPVSYFLQRTRLPLNSIKQPLNNLLHAGLINEYSRQLSATNKGFNFLDSLLQEFIAD